VRRDALGSKRGGGHLHLGEKVRRPDPARARVAGGDPSLSRFSISAVWEIAARWGWRAGAHRRVRDDRSVTFATAGRR
jgi:hypothetical protein